ncbi:MAG: carboxypeptidase regulatory-like domain-containing protein, partial [Candidatus Hydrogenedentes bacterium]|nr:carboxypeptidase regulatory-like domain-containing protein [Candidatus Hydrogenedentota bacterium]
FYVYRGAFGPGRVVTPQELDASLSLLEGSLVGEAALQDIHVVYGACYSGTFINQVSAPGRIIVTSSQPNELSHRGVADPEDPLQIRDGEPFITEYFRALREGNTAKAAFERAAAAIEEFTASTSSGGAVPQHPILDDNGDGAGSPRGSLFFEPGYDGALAHESVLGFGANAAGESVGWFFAPAVVVLAPGQALELEARATETPALGHTAWVEVKTPDFAGADPASTESGPEDDYGDFQQVLDLPAFQSDNTDPADGIFTWATTFGTTFDTPGTYKVYYYIKDGGTGETSAHLLTTVYRQSVVNTPPPVAPLVFPANNQTVSTQSFFVWEESVDPDGDHVSYRIEFATDSGFTQNLVRLDGIENTHTQVPGLVDGRTYYWRVVPIDAFGATPTAALPVRTVTLDNSNSENVGAISGTVLAQTCALAVEGATVKLYFASQSQLQADAETDAHGEFVFPAIAPGTYDLVVQGEGFKTNHVNSIIVRTGDETLVSLAQLEDGGIIGDVDSDGSINALDATLISLYLLFGQDACLLNENLPPDFNPFNPAAADVDLVEGVTSRDATLLNLQQLMGLGPLNAYLQVLAQPQSHAGEPVP